MGKHQFLSGKKILARKMKKGLKVTELVDNYYQAYNSARLNEACRLLVEKMLNPKRDVTIGITLAGAITPAGMSGMFVSMMEKGFIDFVIATGANLYHDMHFALNFPLHKGTWQIDDATLYKHGIVRIYDLFLTTDTLLNTDKFSQEILLDKSAPRTKTGISSSEYHHYFGEQLLKRAPNPEVSILAQATKYNIPVYTSSPGDSTMGMDLAAYSKAVNKKFRRKGEIDLHINPNLDVLETAAIVMGAKENGVMLLGGGSPKNFYLQTQPFLWECLGVEKGGHDYFIQVTMDSPQWGGLCFSKFSNIITANEKIKKAQNVKVGDKLLTVDDENNLTTTKVKKVLKRKIKKGEKICVIKVEDPRVECGGAGVTKGKISGHKVKLVVTEDHPVFTQRGWVKAEELTLKDKILKITQYDKIAFDRENKVPSHLKDFRFRCGKENPMFEKTGAKNPFFGRTHSKETKEFISSLRTGKTWEEIIGEEKARELKQKYHEMMRGEKNPAWAGGISHEPYNEEFFEIRNKALQRDSYKCKVCGIAEKESFKKYNQPLHIHHIDYNKKNSNLDNLLTLCVSCHGKTCFNRESWKEKLVTADDKDCPEFLPIKEIIVYSDRKRITGCLHGEEVYDFVCEPHHKFFADWILIHNSGATPSEAVSWGKINPDELKNTVVVYSDITLAVPILFSYALEKAKPRRHKKLYLKRHKLLYNLEREAAKKPTTWVAEELYKKHQQQ
jgi:deoxyhypusine synthase